MGKSLIITEKPSVAREFAAALHVTGNNNGYIENQDYVITWCVGHLVGLVYPEDYDIKYKKWNLEDLPFLPENYKYNVIKSVKGQYDIVHGMLQREDIDRVYWAGDAGKEGQTIEENIRNFGGVREGMEELRVWIDSQTEEEILRGIREAKPMSAYANLGNSGIMRTIEDYAMGINFSRVMSVKYGRLLNDAAATKEYAAIAVGRVMTCVLGMVVIREREIRNFKETPFYRVIGKFSDAEIEGEWKAVEGSKYFESPLLYKENGFKEEKDANALIEALSGKPAIVKSIEKFVSKKKAPLLFNLAELQAECSKRFKISPNQTLEVAQSLYEKKLTTYPRTDARVLSSAIAKEISKNISRLKGYEPTAAFVNNIMSKGLYKNIANTQYTDDSKVTDHYAIIPTGQLTDLNSLNSLERAVFDVIVRRFLSIFYPPAEYQNVKMTVEIDKEQFFSSAKVLKSEGYLEVAIPPKKKSFAEDNARILGGQQLSDEDGEPNSEESEENNVNPKLLIEIAERLSNGDEISVKGFEIKFGKTSPPKRYTTGSMVLAMENAGQLIEDEELRAQIKGSGIGTSATRAEIIDKLIRIKYLNVNNKSQILTPANLGEMIFEVVNMTVPAMLNPKMTASWEKGLEGITEGTVDFWDYRKKLENYIRVETEKMIGQDIRNELADRISNFAGRDGRGAGARKKIGAKCPVCGGEIVTTPFGYGCANYKREDPESCKFVIGEIAGNIIPEEQVIKLINEGRTELIKGFKSKAGKKFDAILTSNMENNRYNISFEFQDTEPEPVEGLMCPSCGGQIMKTAFGYRCEKYDRENPFGCLISVGNIAGKKLSEEDILKLLTEKKTDTIRGFKSKNGKNFDACLVIKPDENGRDNIVFDFDNVEDEIIEGIKCPACGGAIKKTTFGYGCVNYKRDSSDSCNFSVGQIGGKNLSVANVISLIGMGKTETIRGFKSKNGSKFDACLKLEEVTISNDNGQISENGQVSENGQMSDNGQVSDPNNASGKKTFRVVFDFDNVTDDIVKDVKCPACGGDIKKTSFGFGCVNFRRNDENSCKFSVGQIAGKNLSAPLLKQLINDGKTETIRGFKGKSGKKFDACLVLKKDDNGTVNVEFDFDSVEDDILEGARCPACGGKIKKTQYGYSCVRVDRNKEDGCYFTVGEIGGRKLSDQEAKQLLGKKLTDTIRGFKSKAGKKFDACLKLEEYTPEGSEDKRFRVAYDFDNVEDKKVEGVKCPMCGKAVVVTKFGFRCEDHNWEDESTCRFSISKMADKNLNEAQVKQLLTRGYTDTIRGFKAKSGKKFDARVVLGKDDNGKVSGLKFSFDDLEPVTLKDVKCPKCGGGITKTPFGYGCVNYRKDDPESCRFMIGQIAGVKLKDAQVRQLLNEGKTDIIEGFVAKTGMMFSAPLKLDEEFRVAFDFPEKKEAVEVDISCPKCGQKLKKGQWRLECQCGFNISHTVAKVELSDDIIKELFASGKTTEKIVGFTKKNGEQFDACLKFENDQFAFDFDNPAMKTSEEGASNSNAGKIDFGALDSSDTSDISNFLDSFVPEDNSYMTPADFLPFDMYDVPDDDSDSASDDSDSAADDALLAAMHSEDD